MNPIRDQNYFALDLELNNKSDGTTPKIIEVGIAIGSPVRPNKIHSYNWYLDPEEPIVPFITKLTGITDETIRCYSVPHNDVASMIGQFITTYNCFCNPVVWGGGGEGNDATELKDEFKERDIDFPFFGRRVIDVKTLYVFNQMVKGKSPSGGLRKSMISYGLKFDGTPHKASHDAYNTLKFFFHFLNTQRNIIDAVETLKTL